MECDTGNLPGLSKQISTEQSIPELELKLNHIQRLQGTNASSCSSSARQNCGVLVECTMLLGTLDYLAISIRGNIAATTKTNTTISTKH